MIILLSILGIILSLLLVVGVHEAGHALAAWLFQVKIKRISIGFGKPILRKKTQKGVEWLWSLWPLGGYVHLLNSRIESVKKNQYFYCFDKKPIMQRILILLAGALANFIVAWLTLVLVFMTGYQQHPPVIEAVRIGSSAAKSGLNKGDEFIYIEGRRVRSWRAAGMMLIMQLGKEKVHLTYRTRLGEEKSTTLDLQQWTYKRQNNALLSGMGIKPLSLIVRRGGISFPRAAVTAIHQSGFLLAFYVVSLKQVMTGVIPFTILMGPLGLFTDMVYSFIHGLVAFSYFIASLSLAVGLINLFPLPGLDGAAIVYALVEKVRGKPISVALEVLLYRLAFIAFCVLLVQLLLNDVQRLLS